MIETSGDSHLQNLHYSLPLQTSKTNGRGVWKHNGHFAMMAYGLQPFQKNRPIDLNQQKAPRKCQEYIDAYSMEALAADDFGQKAGQRHGLMGPTLLVKGNKSWRDPFSTSIVVGGEGTHLSERVNHSLHKSDLVTACWMPMIQSIKTIQILVIHKVLFIFQNVPCKSLSTCIWHYPPETNIAPKNGPSQKGN